MPRAFRNQNQNQNQNEPDSAALRQHPRHRHPPHPHHPQRTTDPPFAPNQSQHPQMHNHVVYGQAYGHWPSSSHPGHGANNHTTAPRMTAPVAPPPMTADTNATHPHWSLDYPYRHPPQTTTTTVPPPPTHLPTLSRVGPPLQHYGFSTISTVAFRMQQQHTIAVDGHTTMPRQEFHNGHHDHPNPPYHGVVQDDRQPRRLPQSQYHGEDEDPLVQPKPPPPPPPPPPPASPPQTILHGTVEDMMEESSSPSCHSSNHSDESNNVVSVELTRVKLHPHNSCHDTNNDINNDNDDKNTVLRLSSHSTSESSSILPFSTVPKRLLPPITALRHTTALSSSSSLIIHPNEGPDDLVRYDPDDWYCGEAYTNGSSSSNSSSSNNNSVDGGGGGGPESDNNNNKDEVTESQQRTTLAAQQLRQKKHLVLQRTLALKRKAVQLLLQHQKNKKERLETNTTSIVENESAGGGVARASETPPTMSPVQEQENPPVVSAPVLTKEQLMQRQQELQQAMDAAHWKQLIVKQQTLLSQQKQKVQETQKAISACTHTMQSEQENMQQGAMQEKQCQVQLEALQELREQATEQLLAARRRLHLARKQEAETKPQHGSSSAKNTKQQQSSLDRTTNASVEGCETSTTESTSA